MLVKISKKEYFKRRENSKKMPIIIFVQGLKQIKNHSLTVSWMRFSYLTRKAHCPEPQAPGIQDSSRGHVSARSQLGTKILTAKPPQRLRTEQLP